MKKEEFLYSLKYALRCIGRVMESDVVNKLGFALLVGATTGIIVSILIPKISQNQAETKVSRAKSETEVGDVDRKIEELESLIGTLRQIKDQIKEE